MKIDQVRRPVSPKKDIKRKSDSVDNQPINQRLKIFNNATEEGVR